MSDFDDEDLFSPLMRRLSEELGHIGLHPDAMSLVGSPNPSMLEDDEDPNDEDFDPFSMGPEKIIDQIKDGSGNYAFAVRMVSKDLAWDDRTLRPEKYIQDTEVKTIMPSEHEMLREEIESQIAKGIAPEDIVIPDIYKLDMLTDDDDGEEDETS